MTRGRKPDPAEIRRLKGNPGKRKIVEQLKLPVQIPEPPSALSEPERVEYDKLCTQLYGMRMLTDADAWAVTQAARAIVAIQVFSEDLTARGYLIDDPDPKRAGLVPNPSHKARLDAEKSLRAFFSEFGLTPSARMRVRPDAPTTPNAQQDGAAAHDESFEGHLRALPGGRAG